MNQEKSPGVNWERIRDRRLTLEISQRQLAKRIGTSASRLCGIEHGKNVRLGPRILSALADELGVTVDWILGRE